MRCANHSGTRPPCSGRSAIPERFMRGIVSQVRSVVDLSIFAVSLVSLFESNVPVSFAFSGLLAERTVLPAGRARRVVTFARIIQFLRVGTHPAFLGLLFAHNSSS